MTGLEDGYDGATGRNRRVGAHGYARPEDAEGERDALSSDRRSVLRDAIRVLDDAEYDDLDSSAETIAGYRSVLQGSSPSLRGARRWDEEIDLVVE